MTTIPSALVAEIEYRLRTRGTFGCAIVAFDRHSTMFSGGVGYADLATSSPMTDHTICRVGSISKLLTATLVLRLADRGDLDLDASVNDYLPADRQISNTTPFEARPTVRTLLSHSSGIPAGVRGVDAGNRLLSYAGNQGRIEGLADSIEGLQMGYEPDTRVVYSNPAFNVLGYIAAHSCGVPFEAAVEREVLTPLGMTDSRFCSERSGPHMATHYGAIVPPAPGNAPVQGFRLLATPMGGLTTSVADLAHFGRMILNDGRSASGDVLLADTVGEATAIRVRNHPQLDQGYGLGFKVRPWRGRTLVGHDGNMPGVASQLAVSLEDGIGVAVLTNGYPLAVPHEIAERALDHLLGIAPEPTERSAADAALRHSHAVFGRSIEGTYRLRDTSPPGVLGRLNDLTVRVTVAHEADGRLRVEGNPGSDGPMWLVPEDALGRYRTVSGVDNGASAVIERRDDGNHLWFGFAQHLVGK